MLPRRHVAGRQLEFRRTPLLRHLDPRRRASRHQAAPHLPASTVGIQTRDLPLLYPPEKKGLGPAREEGFQTRFRVGGGPHLVRPDLLSPIYIINGGITECPSPLRFVTQETEKPEFVSFTRRQRVAAYPANYASGRISQFQPSTLWALHFAVVGSPSHLRSLTPCAS